MSTPLTKFKRTAIAKTADGEMVGMTWSWGRWSVVMLYCNGLGDGPNYERAQYAIALRHSTMIGHHLNLPTLRIHPRTVAIMTVMWLINRLSQMRSKKYDIMAAYWQQLMRDLTGDDEINEKKVIFVDADHVRRVYRQMQELKREHSD